MTSRLVREWNSQPPSSASLVRERPARPPVRFPKRRGRDAVVIGAAAALTCVTTSWLLIGYEVVSVFVLVALLVTSALCFVSRTGGLALARIFEIPVLLTTRIVVNFGVAPVLSMISTQGNGMWYPESETLVECLVLVLLGMLSFWAACNLATRKPSSHPPRRSEAPLYWRLTAISALYAIGFGCKLYLLTHQLFAYTGSVDTYRSDLSGPQVYMFCSGFATYALVMISIEVFSGRKDTVVRWLFWAILISECGWGLISGMKEFLLTNFLVVALVSTLYRGKLAKTWTVSCILGLIGVYPLYDAYRIVLRGPGAAQQITSVSGALSALAEAVPMVLSNSASEHVMQTGAQSTVSRLDLLQYFALVRTLPAQGAELQGDEQLWMIPFYPFLPRLFWEDKPVLDKGVRFNQALNGGTTSSTAVPYVTDCFIYGGAAGVSLGMFVFGFVAQSLTKMRQGTTTKEVVFRYCILLLVFFRIEAGVFEFWTMLIKTAVIVGAIGWITYNAAAGPSRADASSADLLATDVGDRAVSIR